MSDDIATALIALGGVFLSVFVSYLVSLKTTRYNYKQLFAETVSQSRNKWLNEMRDYISEMLANKRRMVYRNVDEKSAVEICNKYDTCKFQVLMRLNINESDHRQLRALIMTLDEFGIEKTTSTDIEKYQQIELAIIEISRKILKEEWDKVRLESKGEGETI